MKDGQQCFNVRTAVDTWCTQDGTAKLEKQAAAEAPTGEGQTESIWSNPKQLELSSTTTAERKRHGQSMHRVEHKEHISEYNREYYQEHKEHKSEYNREYREVPENSEKAREYYQEHKEHLSEYNREYYQENKEYYQEYYQENKEYYREYYQENKEHISETSRSRRAVDEAARAERDFELLAERGEDRTYDEFLDAVEDESQKCMVQLVSGLLEEGRGINILCAGKNRTPPNRSNQQDADGSSFGRIEVSGIPPDGDSSDETRRWAVHDPRPSVIDGRTHSSLSGPRFDALFEKFLVRTHRYHEFVRMFEGQVQRLVCSDSYEKYWSLYLNSKTGDLDGTRYLGECSVLIAATKKPLQQLYDEGELIRAKPGWSGLVGKAPLRTLVEKLREGSESMAQGARARPELEMLRTRTVSAANQLSGPVTLLREVRLICDADLGHINRKRPAKTRSHAFYDVRHWNDGTVAGHFGVLGNEAHGGQHVIIGLHLNEEAAVRLLEKEVRSKVREGYHERASVLEEAEAEPETEAETEAEQAKASFCGVCDEEIVGRDLDHGVYCTAPPPAKRSRSEQAASYIEPAASR